MFEFLKKFAKNSVDTNEDMENAKNQAEIREHNPSRAVIDGLLYDTSKAEKVVTFYSCIANGSFFATKDLYMTKNRRFFSVSCLGGYIQTETEEEVKKILSQRPEKYQEIFGKVEEA